MKKLMPIFYLPPISWWIEFLKEDAAIILEKHENLPKQTYRNRTVIYGANGRLPLIIPIHHNGKRSIQEIEISHAEDWRKLHWKSIKIAYQSSPYFEYYEDRIQEMYQFETKNLIEFNLNCIDKVLKILKIEPSFVFSEEYQKTPDAEDYREKFNAKKISEHNLQNYYQTFEEKLGFQKDLSVLDLLCNLGPESYTYLKNNTL